ncbi:cyclic pyranopterin monophosphate synthase MoaC [[Clostridium] fimetarium]|uniref:Cyclic pyranopterin monophosphate synthase n=1 Tax=[Clostridium] fimetarium TaxID=99656 RepID=A0A1I0RAK5_9FIRM|nr:cyclic pyranopterin monophosphate synthase MoaC [[Clostridium] fimetarium]SEW37862.1 cyclic pyranopterin phosphate synthase [[Clostridium] fimetarium]
MGQDFSHFDENGNAIMVDVTEKLSTKRAAIATGTIQVSSIVMEKIKHNTVEKGDVLSVARIAGIMATKRTGELIPLCHPLMLTNSSIDFELDTEKNMIRVLCTAKLEGKTGVEMEALTGATVALLTIYDMCKAIDKGMIIGQIYLLKKTGGKSGTYEVI